MEVNMQNYNNYSMDDWFEFIKQVNKNPQCRNVTFQAWKRCQDIGFDPNNLVFVYLEDNELKRKQEEHQMLINLALPYMENLSHSLIDIPHIVALTDSEGWVLEILGTTEAFGGRSAGMCKGVSWNEKHIGNNGIGTCLVTGEATLVYGIEHYSNEYKNAACIGVPIRYNNEIIGAMDVSVPTVYAHPERMNLITACVNSIEHMYHEQKQSKDYQAITEMLPLVFHDIKNPFSIISGLAKVGDMVTEDEKNYYKKIVQQASILDNMLNDFIHLFKPQTPTLCHVKSFIGDVLIEIKPLCDLHNIILEYQSDVEVHSLIHKPLFKRAVKNIIENAIKVMKDEGKIEINLSTYNQNLLLSITDDGPGIPSELKDTLFKPHHFKRIGGSGLGLFMVHHTIKELHRGEIWFDTKLNKGTTFYIRMPINLEHKKCT